MRKITSHKVNGLNEAIDITVMDESGPGNACREYNVTIHHGDGTAHSQEVNFQKGPIAESGPNGTSNEALLAIVEDRLLGFQSGPYACRENTLALTRIQEAIVWLHNRTRQRMAMGVEGTGQK